MTSLEVAAPSPTPRQPGGSVSRIFLARRKPRISARTIFAVASDPRPRTSVAWVRKMTKQLWSDARNAPGCVGQASVSPGGWGGFEALPVLSSGPLLEGVPPDVGVGGAKA